MRNYKLLILFLILFPVAGYSQLEHKVTAQVSLGLPLIKKAGPVNAENIFYGYKKLPYVGFGVMYNNSVHFSMGGMLRQLYTKKDFYSLSHTSLGLVAKYNFIPSDKKMSPFVTAELNTGYVVLSQKPNSTIEYPKVTDQAHVAIVEQERKYPEIKTGFATFGALAGVGVDFTLKLKYKLSFSANYFVSDAAKNPGITVSFPENTSKLRFLLLQTGFSFSFGKSKSLY